MLPVPTQSKAATLASVFKRSVARYGEATKPARLGFIVDATGNRMFDHGWLDSAETLVRTMAGVRCKTGLTQILPALQAMLDEPAERRAQAIVLVGDCFEEDADHAEMIATALKQVGVRVFSFHEGDDEFGAAAFRMFAQTTGGRFARLGDELPLADFCEGVALLTAGGRKALARLPDSRAKRLLLADMREDKGAKR